MTHAFIYRYATIIIGLTYGDKLDTGLARWKSYTLFDGFAFYFFLINGTTFLHDNSVAKFA